MAEFLFQLIDSFRFTDFLDISIISILIYLVVIWFEATASRFVLLGIFILGVIYILARLFNMYLTAVVLQAFFAILLISLVVIFQEELRRFFERISMWSSLRKGNNVFSGYPEIEIISRTMNELARKKIGALVVIRGTDPLDRHLEGGYELDGRLSQPLLESLFDPHSFGHDGAVIIDHGRLSRFACHLPLSSNIQALGMRGTRHSAALGLAERSDALVIVVSEERGTISLAKEERLVELTDPLTLQAELEKFALDKFPKNHRTWLQWIREKSKEKAIAVVLACVLWFVFIYQTGTVRRDFVVPVEYRNLKANWVIEEPMPKEVMISLAGRTRAFDLVDMRALKVVVDMEDIEQGHQDIMLTANSVTSPSSLSVIDIEPKKIRVAAYQLVQANLPVHVRTHGKIPAGLKVSRTEVSPDTIPVLIPSKAVNGSLKVTTESIDLRKLTETTTVTPSLVLPAGARYAGPRPPKVDVRVEVTRITQS
ncbi:MAG: hypothetical protein C4520_07015 [Candidatus Abyssobacteria bacterium SURF_5]|uniref:Diadenylate cyclase n=1 Tax=Abyssobacteria bacterium (strain SURF_5) TaxID=2093360 RepID=A0A3A4P541_ABYX5|nr:MAG: hypothetical protein C4520_07015 [Candidatus Abyssubacteria bacterium SURF_5]